MLVNDEDTNKFTVGYWNLKNKDPGMIKFGEERADLIINEFEKLAQKYCRGSYEYVKNDKSNNKNKEEPLNYKSNQRIDFMRNVYLRIIQRVSSKLSELEDERDKRTW